MDTAVPGPASGRSGRRRQKLGAGWSSPVAVGVEVARSDLQNSSAGRTLESTW